MGRGLGGAGRTLVSVLAGFGLAPVVWGGLALAASSAGANTAPYELVCPGTPVGTVVLDNVVTDGSLSPASPSSGQQFSVTGFQTQVTLKGSLLSAAAAFGTSLSGSATSTIVADNATPSSISGGTVSYNVPIPSPTPSSLALNLPSAPATVGPFTATGSPIVAVDKTSTLVISVAGNNISLTCTAYPNDSNPTSTGILAGSSQSSPGAIAGTPIYPVIAPSGATYTPGAASSSTPSSTPTTSAAPSTTPATSASGSTPATSSNSLAFTGPSPDLWIIGIAGLVLLDLGYLLLTAVDSPRRLLRRALGRVTRRAG
jgi:hypothetical protein